jgi:hypothetical protein
MGQMSKISKNNTAISRNADGSIVVRLHSTDVVTVATDGTVTLNTGGWNTVTTRARMNQAANEFNLGFRVFQEKHSLYVRVFDSKPYDFAIGHTLPFDDRTISFSVSA